MKITVDLNVLLDVAQHRLPHYAAFEEVLLVAPPPSKWPTSLTPPMPH